MNNNVDFLIEILSEEISVQEEKQEALVKICNHNNGEKELSDDELTSLADQYKVSKDEISIYESIELEGYIKGLEFSLNSWKKVQKRRKGKNIKSKADS